MINIQKNISLKKFTSWLVGGEADFFCTPHTIEDVIDAQKWAEQNRQPVTVLGGGSNVLISDRGVRGLVIALKSLVGTEVKQQDGRLQITCLAGTSKSELLKNFLKHKLPPALFLAGLPGDVGGGIVMNAGVAESFTPREFVQLTDWIEVLKPDHSIKRYNKSEITWHYRHSEGWQPGIVVRVGLSWPLQEDASILEQVKNANRNRLTKQPLDMPSGGSTFKNPDGHKAAQLIDQAGLKGFTIGGAQVSRKHANFIVNLGEATASDIDQVIQNVKKVVLEKSGIALNTEVVYLGEW
jgi:UDP-N-acetylmuramate dehydrogenase